MKELSPRARALIEAGCEAEEGPSKNERARVQARLTALLGASAFGAAGAAASGAAAATSAGGSAAAGAVVSKGASAIGTGVAASGGGGATGLGAGATGLGAAANIGTVAASGGATGLGAGATGLGAAAAKIGTAAGTVAAGSAGATGAAAAGWVASLGAKGVAWIGAAALSAAVGTTALVTRQSDQPARDAHVLAASRSNLAAPSVQEARNAAEQPSSQVAPATAPAEHAADAMEQPAAVSASSQAAPAGRAIASDAPRQPAPRAAAAVSGKRNPVSSSAASHTPANPTAPPNIPASVAALETPVSAARLAALASSTSDAQRTEAATTATDKAVHGLVTDDDSEAELLPQPTDPEAMRAVPATSREPARAPQLPATDATTPSHPINPGATLSGITTAAPPAQPTQSKAGAPQPGGALSGELGLLAQAQRALHDGKLSLALTLLDQHSAQHAQGSLREERLAARAVVLCRMQQFGAGNAEAQRLAAQTPRSPLLPWVRSACRR